MRKKKINLESLITRLFNTSNLILLVKSSKDGPVYILENIIGDCNNIDQHLCYGSDFYKLEFNQDDFLGGNYYMFISDCNSQINQFSCLVPGSQIEPGVVYLIKNSRKILKK